MRAAGYAAASNPYTRNAVRAARVIQFAYRHRRKIRRAYMGARQVVKYARKRKMMPKASKNMEPAPKRRALAYGDSIPTLPDTYALANLFGAEVNFPTFNTINNLRTRERLDVYIKGIKWCRVFKLPYSTVKCPPVMVHWAVIQPKVPNQNFIDFLTQARLRFFRWNGDTNDREFPFADNITSSPWSASHNCLPMNPDANFNIIYHKKRVLHQEFEPNTGFQFPQHMHTWKIDFYGRIKKAFTYRNLTDVSATHPLYEVWWYQTVTPDNYPNPSNGVFLSSYKMHNVYWSERNR